MGVMEVTREMLAAKFETIFPHLDERQRRLLMGAEARALQPTQQVEQMIEYSGGTPSWPTGRESNPAGQSRGRDYRPV